MKALGFTSCNQLKVHPFQSSGFEYVNLHPYIEGMDLVDLIYDGYGGDPDQGQIQVRRCKLDPRLKPPGFKV